MIIMANPGVNNDNGRWWSIMQVVMVFDMLCLCAANAVDLASVCFFTRGCRRGVCKTKFATRLSPRKLPGLAIYAAIATDRGRRGC